MEIPVAAVHWAPCFRIIPSRFPPINLFEAVADPADLEAVFQIEAMTNDRLREEAGELALVPPQDRVSGPGTSPIMAAFTHLNAAGDRFTDGSYGVFYAGLTLETAVSETTYHRAVFLRATDEPAQEVDMCVYACDLAADLHDIRDMRSDLPALYHLSNYGVSQRTGARASQRGLRRDRLPERSPGRRGVRGGVPPAAVVELSPGTPPLLRLGWSRDRHRL